MSVLAEILRSPIMLCAILAEVGIGIFAFLYLVFSKEYAKTLPPPHQPRHRFLPTEAPATLPPAESNHDGGLTRPLAPMAPHSEPQPAFKPGWYPDSTGVHFYDENGNVVNWEQE